MESAPERRLIVYHASEHAFVPMTRTILANMGYAILSLDQWRNTPGYASREPELRIVDERRFAEVPRREPAGPVPIVLLTGRAGISQDDSRILGAVRRPAGLHELYRLLQRALEENPRSAPRLVTDLEAVCRNADREWHATVRSLSESGCLLRTEEPLPLGTELEIRFELPQLGTVETLADCTYQLPPDIGLVFQATPPDSRRAIQLFVEQGWE